MTSDDIDILIISETKLDESSPTNQFQIDGYMPPIRADRNRHGRGLMIYLLEKVYLLEKFL